MEAPRPESAKVRLRTASAGQRGLPRPRVRSGIVAVGVLVLVGALLGSAATPPAAQAGISIPNPMDVIGSGIGSLLGGAAGPIASLAVKAFEAIIQHLFAPLAKLVTVALIGWLTAIPNFAQGNVAHLEQTVAAICGGVLGAVATLSVIRYWLAGFASGGDSGFSALEGLVRTIAAALFIAIWPWLFERAIGLTNLLSGALLSSGITEKEVAKLLEAGLGGAIAVGATSGFTAGFGLFLTIAIAVAASLLFLGLLLLKIVVSISTILLYVGMPFAAVLWPITPWIGRLVGRAFAVCLAVPVLWTLCFAAAAALSADTLTLNQLTGSARRGAEHASLTTGGDRAALRDGATTAAPLANGDARWGVARRRVRRPCGQLCGRLTAARYGPTASAGIARRPLVRTAVRERAWPGAAHGRNRGGDCRDRRDGSRCGRGKPRSIGQDGRDIGGDGSCSGDRRQDDKRRGRL